MKGEKSKNKHKEKMGRNKAGSEEERKIKKVNK
jgi:hypothetical protein